MTPVWATPAKLSKPWRYPGNERTHVRVVDPRTGTALPPQGVAVLRYGTHPLVGDLMAYWRRAERDGDVTFSTVPQEPPAPRTRRKAEE